MSEKYSWQKQQNDRREQRRIQQKKPKSRKPLPKQKKKTKKKSKKLSVAERIYSLLRKDFLLDNPICQCQRPGCTGIATEVHHKKGRGIWLNVVKFFLAVCDSCHKWIEGNPEEAKRLGYSLKRNGGGRKIGWTPEEK